MVYGIVEFDLCKANFAESMSEYKYFIGRAVGNLFLITAKESGMSVNSVSDAILQCSKVYKISDIILKNRDTLSNMYNSLETEELDKYILQSIEDEVLILYSNLLLNCNVKDVEKMKTDVLNMVELLGGA